MLQYLEYFISISQLFVFINAEPLLGERVYPADPLEYPFVASLGLKLPNEWPNRRHFCTGSLITRHHVVTAAHCFAKKRTNETDVIVGEEDWRTASNRYDVDWWITYETWSRRNRKLMEFPINDVAIVKLLLPVDRVGVTPVSLVQLNDQQLCRTKALMVGWGVTNENTLSDVLLKGKVTILTADQCEHQLKLVSNQRLKVNKNYLSTSADPYILSGCGDSGGPLLNKDKFLLGITRSTCPGIHWGDFSIEFLNQYKVNLHSSVNYYRDFIENVTARPETNKKNIVLSRYMIS